MEPRWHRAKHWGALGSEHRQRAGTKSGGEGQQSPVWLEQGKGVRGAGGRPERFPEKHNVNTGLPNPG